MQSHLEALDYANPAPKIAKKSNVSPRNSQKGQTLSASCPIRSLSACKATPGSTPCSSGKPKNWTSAITVVWPTDRCTCGTEDNRSDGIEEKINKVDTQIRNPAGHLNTCEYSYYDK